MAEEKERLPQKVHHALHIPGARAEAFVIPREETTQGSDSTQVPPRQIKQNSKSTGAIPKSRIPPSPNTDLSSYHGRFSSHKQNQSDQHIPLRERKKWHRPSLVGQNPGCKSVLLSGRTDELIEAEEFQIEETPVVYEPAERESMKCDSFSASVVLTSDFGQAVHSESSFRVVSPTSSAASGRPLEWDSGADVGYQLQQYIPDTPKPLTSIEKLTLGYLRTDPEGQNQTISPLIVGTRNQQVQSFQGSMNPPLTSTPYQALESPIVIPPLNLDALLSNRERLHRKYGSLDSLNTVDKGVKYRSSSHSNLMKKVVFQAASNSSSSVATVVSKQRRSSPPPPIRTQSASSKTDSNDSQNAGVTLMKNINEGVALLQKLMSQAKTQTEQQLLLSHVINQLTGTKISEASGEPLSAKQQTCDVDYELNLDVGTLTEVPAECFPLQSELTSAESRSKRSDSQASRAAEIEMEYTRNRWGLSLKVHGQDEFTGIKLLQEKHLAKRSEAPPKLPREGRSSSVTSSQPSRKLVSSQQVSSCHSQQVSTSERASWSSSHVDNWPDNQLPEHVSQPANTNCDEPTFLTFLENRVEGERVNRAIWLADLIENLQRRKRFLLREQERSRAKLRDKKKLEGDGRSRSNSDSSSTPRSRLTRSQSGSIYSTKSSSRKLSPVPASPPARNRVTGAIPTNSSETRVTGAIPTNSSDLSTKPVKSRATPYEASNARKRPTQNQEEVLFLHSKTLSKSSKLTATETKAIKSRENAVLSQPTYGSRTNETYDNLSVESLSINSSGPADTLGDVTMKSKPDNRPTNSTSDILFPMQMQDLKSKSGSSTSVVSAPVVNRRPLQDSDSMPSSARQIDVKENKKPARPKTFSKPSKLFFEVPFTDANSQSSQTYGDDDDAMSLQEALQRHHPQFVRHADSRRTVLSELARRRMKRLQMRRERLQEAESSESVMEPLPPPPLAEQRIFKQKDLLNRTRQKVKNLAEVQAKKEEERRKEEYETNRTLAQVFRRKLQRRVLNKKVSMSNSMSVISSE